MIEDKTSAGFSFADLNLAPEVLQAVTDAGYTHPTPIQQQAIPLALAGRDLIGLAHTGTGKTAGFTLPIIHNLISDPITDAHGRPLHRVRVLILTPTRELAAQVEESFRKYGKHTALRVVPIFGGVGIEPQSKALRSGVDVVVATPGRLLDHMERQNVVFDDLEVLVLDEADRMLDMGFAPQLNRIVNEIPPYRQTLLFSATMPPEVEALARKYLRKPVVVQVGRRSEAVGTVTHAVYPVPRARKNTLLVELLKESAMDSVLIFTRTKHGADRVVRHLEDHGIAATAMHADKSQGERTRALDDFKSGKIRVLVATDIAQRGLDVSGITHVINYDVPQQPEDYVHRIGRTGRAAATGDAYTFMSTDEIAMVRTIERTIGQRIPRISVPGYDFGTTAESATSAAGESATDGNVAPPPSEISVSPDQASTQPRYRRPRSVARRR
ncbi:MAG TPA: DEAD/DEAH box helicase [Gemmatimonadaceae bacterium]|jgi:ATP-dependent RNA helicase RhlE|nr:DEAD/DEAH box helicase [Gemmatimonadaceae bacterium]